MTTYRIVASREHAINEAEALCSARAKTLQPKDMGSSGVRHAAEDGAEQATRQSNATNGAAPEKLHSPIRNAGRSTASTMLKWALAPLSSGEVGAVIDDKDSRVRAMLAGHMPWKAEAFVLTGERMPEVGVRIIVVYAHLIATRWGHEWIDRIIDALRDLQNGRVEVPAC